MRVFRISRGIYAKTLSASGRQNRWNTDGKLVLYTASSLSLACLETVVYSSGDLLYIQDYKSIEIEVPDGISLESIKINALPKNWTDKEQKDFTQKIGDEWYHKKEVLILQVPSAIVFRESNFLINTRHPDFNKVAIAELHNFMFDKSIKG